MPPFPPIAPIPPITPIEYPPPIAPTKRTDSAAAPFFLEPRNLGDHMAFRGAVRDALNVTPIIDGQRIFEAVESAIEKAEKSVLLAFWALDPEMKMVTDSGTTWKELLVETAERDVMTRVLLTDFDPGLQLLQHATVWARYLTMIGATSHVPIDKFQIVCSHHEAETSAATVGLVRKRLYDTLAEEINKIPNEVRRKEIFWHSPGLWDKLDLQADGRVSPKVKDKNYPAWPAVHHQKLVIVDGKYAFTGGVNVTSQYVDTQKHEKPQLPWHDAFVKVEGSTVVRDFIRNYIGLWNHERVRAEAFLTQANNALNVKVPLVMRQTTELKPADVPAVLTSTVPPKIASQVHRTITKKGTDVTGVPDIVRQDVLEGYVQAIGQAEAFIYIENQYFREKVIANAIIQRHAAQPGLKTIILLPKIIEEFLNSQGDQLSLHGAALQFELLGEMNNQIGADLGLFALERKDKALVYVHSKLLLIDDRFASIGSANANPRSFRVDTELDFVWAHEATVRKLRFDLWNEILGKPAGLSAWRPSQFVKKWSDIAKKNDGSGAGSRKGLVIPFRNENEGKRSLPLVSPFV